MALFYLTLFIFIGGVLAEPSLTISVTKAKAKQGSEVDIICSVSNTGDDTNVKIKKYVEIDERDDKGNKKVYEEDLSLNDAVEPHYLKTKRHSGDSVANGDNGMDYIITIKDLKPEDSAVYTCSIAGTVAYDTTTLEVYTKPMNVHFMNFSNWDLNVDVLQLDEGQTENVGCMAMGGVPLPRFEVVVGENNYTKKFKHYESEVVLPECYEEGSMDNCYLHFSTESEIEAMDFRPHYTADGQYLECKAYIDGSGMQPVSAKLKIMMRYKPKFYCFPKHKVAIHSVNYELKCSVLTNPDIEEVYFEFPWNGEKVTLKEGQSTSDKEIEFSKRNRVTDTETEVVLKFKEVFERHYETIYTLVATNSLGQNSTGLELVDENYVRGSASVVVCSGILALITCVMSFLML